MYLAGDEEWTHYNFQDDDDLFDDGDPDDDDSHVSKRRRLDERILEKRRTKRAWEENCQRLLFDYVQFSYYGRSVSFFFIFT